MIEKYVKDDFASYEDFFENYNVNIPDSFNFAFDVVDEYAAESPSRTALVWCNEHGEEAAFTFGDMKYYSNKAANFFKSLGVKKGDRVMLILKRRFEFWFSILALHKIGAICIPATHMLAAEDIIYRNNSAKIKMIVAVNEDRVIKSVDESEGQSPSLEYKVVVGGKRNGWIGFNEGIEKASDVFLRPAGPYATQNDDISLIYFTSGTTGMPKMVQHDFVYPLGHIITAKYWQRVKDGGLHLTVADTGWAKAVWGKLYGQWICGSAVMVYDFDMFQPKSLLKVIEKYGVTTFCAPPTVYRYFIKENLRDYDLSSLEHCTAAGEPLNPEVYHQFLKSTGIKIAEGYGQTELTVVMGTFPWDEPKPGSIGRPSPGYDIDLMDEQGKSCRAGEKGQIVVRTHRTRPLGMFKGYYLDESQTKGVWHDDIYYTGDMAWYDEDGYYWFVSRADDVIKSSGYRIGPSEVENALMGHPSVLECAITAVPDRARGEVVKATIVLNKGYVPCESLKRELKAYVKKVTAPYKYPRIIEFVNNLPKTISGKIRRVEIRENDTVNRAAEIPEFES